MKHRSIYFYFFLMLLAFSLSGCIHEYPYATKNSQEKGKDPTTLNAFIEVSYNLSWQQILHNVDFSAKTRGRTERPHRFIIELIRDGEVVYHETEYLTADEFINGKMKHKISVPLAPRYYHIAVWYDFENENGQYHFDADNLGRVALINFSTEEKDVKQCAFGADDLDLTDYSPADDVSVVKELEMEHPGARFEVVATDVQQFITEQKPALNQGDTFTIHFQCSGRLSDIFNLHTGNIQYRTEGLEYSGWMRLPFAEYDELKIGEGYIFCDTEDEVNLKLWVTSSSLVTVSKTDLFNIPVKRGHITTIRGDFLCHPLDGIFTINNIWDGEIIYEI